MMRLLSLIPLLLLCGCVHRNVQSPVPDVTNVRPLTPGPVPSDPVALAVESPASFLIALHQVLGPAGEMTLATPSPQTFTAGETSVTIPARTSLRYTLSEARGELVFGDPRPTVSARVLGFKVSPNLMRLELRPDNSGTATVASGPITATRPFRITWDALPDPGKSSATGSGKEADALPVVSLLHTDWCVYCPAAIRAVKAAESSGLLPFRVELVNVDRDNDQQFDAGYTWLRGVPAFDWRDQSDQWWTAPWEGQVDALINRWTQSGGRAPNAPASGARSGGARSSGSSYCPTCPGYRRQQSSTWTFPGSSRTELIEHLLNDGIHAGRFSRQYLMSQPYDQLHALHDDHHSGQVAWNLVR